MSTKNCMFSSSAVLTAIFVVVSLELLSLPAFSVPPLRNPHEVVAYNHKNYVGPTQKWTLEPGKCQKLVPILSLRDIQSLHIGSAVGVMLFDAPFFVDVRFPKESLLAVEGQKVFVEFADTKMPYPTKLDRIFFGSVPDVKLIGLEGYPVQEWKKRTFNPSLVIFRRELKRPLGVYLSSRVGNSLKNRFGPIFGRFYPAPENELGGRVVYPDLDESDIPQYRVENAEKDRTLWWTKAWPPRFNMVTIWRGSLPVDSIIAVVGHGHKTFVLPGWGSAKLHYPLKEFGDWSGIYYLSVTSQGMGKKAHVQAPVAPSISGRWDSTVGKVYHIKQDGNKFSWTVENSIETASGTITGKEVSATWKIKGKIGGTS
ncbi:MAG: hypothetical protein ACYS0I_16335, partial [Planctomycetota bacterium]